MAILGVLWAEHSLSPVRDDPSVGVVRREFCPALVLDESGVDCAVGGKEAALAVGVDVRDPAMSNDMLGLLRN